MSKARDRQGHQQPNTKGDTNSQTSLVNKDTNKLYVQIVYIITMLSIWNQNVDTFLDKINFYVTNGLDKLIDLDIKI